MASTKQLVDWVKTKLVDDSLPMSERTDFELFWQLMQRRKDLKPSENRQLQKLSKDLEQAFNDEQEDTQEASGEWLCTTGQLCGLFARTRKSIAEWVKMGMPQIARGQYDFKQVFPWWLENLYRAPEDKDESITEWRRRERAAKAQQAELLLGNMRGDFVRADHHEAVLVELCGELRNTMLSWPSRLAPIDDKMRSALREEIHNLLRNFQKWESFADPDRKIKRKAGKDRAKGKTKHTTVTGDGKKPTTDRAGRNRQVDPVRKKRKAS
jgi:phage terminase Nu1 subunit (DNA packaging protein)